VISSGKSAAEKYTRKTIEEMIAVCVKSSRAPDKINIITDTSNFYKVDYDDVIILEDRPYLIRNCKMESRFGISDQPKFWVKSAIDLITGNRKIIKMVFHEKFKARIGDLTFNFFRSPRKEARILSLVKGHPKFMQGFGVKDSAGNIIRVIDNIPGNTIESVTDLGKNHEDYFWNYFPSVLDDFMELIKAIGFLHENGEHHGDIRRDHILKDIHNGNYKWIDFDYTYWHGESIANYDLFGLGNVLIYLAGRGDVIIHDLRKNNQALFDQLSHDDLNIIFQNRVANLRKIYPYIPDVFNFILLHFSSGANIYYDNASQIIQDLGEAKGGIF
jgi:serine/threonine protein kinase